MEVDARYRDKDGEISRKHGNELIGTLRITYGSGFAKDSANDEKLSDVLAKLDERSLSKLVRDYKSGMLPIRLRKRFLPTTETPWPQSIKARNVSPERPSISVALPLLIAAADEDRQELQDLRARLLAAAADPKRTKSFRGAFIDVAMDAVVLQQAGATNQVITETIRNDVAAKLNLSRDQLDVSLSHLIELNLMWGMTVSQTPDATVAPLGREFLRAITD
jgi:hypothetical protein